MDASAPEALVKSKKSISCETRHQITVLTCGLYWTGPLGACNSPRQRGRTPGGLRAEVFTTEGANGKVPTYGRGVGLRGRNDDIRSLSKFPQFAHEGVTCARKTVAQPASA